MNKENIIKSANYKLLAEYVWISHVWIKTYFNRKGLKIDNPEDVKKYIDNRAEVRPWIYIITNMVNAKRYIWRTTNLQSRKSKHYCDLRAKRHMNIQLQKDFNIYWEDNFSFNVLKYIDCDTERAKLEERYITESDSSTIYNIEFTDKVEVLKNAIYNNREYFHNCLKYKKEILEYLHNKGSQS